MRAADVMTDCVVSISSDASVFDAAETLIGMHFSAVPVVDGAGKLVGIVSEADLMRRPEIGTVPRQSWLSRMMGDGAKAASEYVAFHSRRVADVMTKTVISVSEDATLAEVAEAMTKHGVKRLPVLRDGFVLGIVSRSNLLQALMSREPRGDTPDVPDEQLRLTVREAVDKKPWSSSWPTNVMVSAGVVHLWGFVSNNVERDAYRVAAENVTGVRKVKNHIRTIPPSVHLGV